MMDAGGTSSANMQSALAALAPRISTRAHGVENLQRLSGGATQEIWRFDLREADGATPLILRRAPGGGGQADAGLGMEVRLIEAAAAQGVPVPSVRYVLQEADGLGQGFIMGFVAGETLGGRIVKAEALAGARRILAGQCGEILARIHGIDPAGFASLPHDAPAALVARWHGTYRALGVKRPVFEYALRWLADTAPPAPARWCLVHGDFRNGNLMVGPEGVRAVLDWELAHVGDAMEDLGWICVNSWRFGRIDHPVGGFGSREDLWARYEAAGGAKVNRASAKWWEVLGTLRWGVICASAVPAFRGADPSVERAMIARRTSETEIDILRLLRS